ALFLQTSRPSLKLSHSGSAFPGAAFGNLAFSCFRCQIDHPPTITPEWAAAGADVLLRAVLQSAQEA
ncbi:hypothetical protein, partial [Burkholderia aenigmatica]|uniref:hypothetical protein n=1 Tax=Burkholderia aenigmatica TaxID=2015348 RepID=UPI0011788D75